MLGRTSAMVEAGRRGLVWTEAELDRFLIDAETALPGASMPAP